MKLLEMCSPAQGWRPVKLTNQAETSSLIAESLLVSLSPNVLRRLLPDGWPCAPFVSLVSCLALYLWDSVDKGVFVSYRQTVTFELLHTAV